MKKILLILLLFSIIIMQGLAATYTSQYPPVQSDDYVKSTTKFSTDYWAYYATDPAKSLTGGWGDGAWVSANGEVTNQRFHFDLGSAKIIRRIYYENGHSSGGEADKGAENFTFWGSNTGAGTFDDLVYANDEGWTEITVSQNTFDQHTWVDEADPHYITATNIVAYRYYAFKFADTRSETDYMGIRRIELQTEDFALVRFNNVILYKWNELALIKWNAMSIP